MGRIVHVLFLRGRSGAGKGGAVGKVQGGRLLFVCTAGATELRFSEQLYERFAHLSVLTLVQQRIPSR